MWVQKAGNIDPDPWTRVNTDNLDRKWGQDQGANNHSTGRLLWRWVILAEAGRRGPNHGAAQGHCPEELALCLSLPAGLSASLRDHPIFTSLIDARIRELLDIGLQTCETVRWAKAPFQWLLSGVCYRTAIGAWEEASLLVAGTWQCGLTGRSWMVKFEKI